MIECERFSNSDSGVCNSLGGVKLEDPNFNLMSWVAGIANDGYEIRTVLLAKPWLSLIQI